MCDKIATAVGKKSRNVIYSSADNIPVNVKIQGGGDSNSMKAYSDIFELKPDAKVDKFNGTFTQNHHNPNSSFFNKAARNTNTSFKSADAKLPELVRNRRDRNKWISGPSELIVKEEVSDEELDMPSAQIPSSSAP